jgi:2-C-methyl-D-erythritol 4-phosphate cytidylyltransferase
VPSYAVILPAAGRSSRFGGMEKKPFVALQGKAIWQRSAELFWTRPNVSKVYVVISPGDRSDFRERFGHVVAFANAELVDGGSERFESVANALAKIPDDVDFVTVHDAVRPMTAMSHIDAVFAKARETGAAMLAVPVADTLKRVDPTTQTIKETVSRENLWQAQTPQVFRRDWLCEAYAQRGAFGPNITDDAQLVEAAGHPVSVVVGSPLNFKITTQDDLKLAEKVYKPGGKAADKPGRPLGFHEDVKW